MENMVVAVDMEVMEMVAMEAMVGMKIQMMGSKKIIAFLTLW
jgi:hypothetical protein